MTEEKDEIPSVREICGELYWAIDVDSWVAERNFNVKEDALIIDTAVGVLARHIGETITASLGQHATPRPYASHLSGRKYVIKDHPQGGHTPEELTNEIIQEIRKSFTSNGLHLSENDEKILVNTTVGILMRHIGIVLEDDQELPCSPHPV
jgi:hypothetical protein